MEEPMTAKIEDKYLNAAAYVQRLERKLAAKRIDTAEALDALGAAAKHCRVNGKAKTQIGNSFLRRGDLYLQATAIYISKAREICRSNGGGFGAWCLGHGMTRSTGATLAKIGRAPDPAAALQEFRDNNRKHVYNSIERSTGKRPTSRDPDDPLANIKIHWNKLSLSEQQAFLAWVLTAGQQKLAA
jgi:hypothetical protein